MRLREETQRAGQVPAPNVENIVFGLAAAQDDRVFPKDRNKWKAHHVTMSNELVDEGNNIVADWRGSHGGAYPSNLYVEGELKKKFDERLVKGIFTPTKTTAIQAKREQKYAGETLYVGTRRASSSRRLPSPRLERRSPQQAPPSTSSRRHRPPSSRTRRKCPRTWRRDSSAT